MPLPLFRKKVDKDKLDKGFKNASFVSLHRTNPTHHLDKGSRNASFASLPRVSTPGGDAEECIVEYNVEPESSNAPAPDTRLLSSLGGCTVQVSTIETLEPLPHLGYPRRGSSMSAYSTASGPLLTPTFPREPHWEPNSTIATETQPDDNLVPVDSPNHVQTFSHRWASSNSGELDLNQLLNLTGGATNNSSSPFGFEMVGNKPPPKRKPRPVFDDEDDFYVPGLQASLNRRGR